MRNTYHTLPEDTALFDRLRHRAYAYTRGDNFHIVSVYVRPAYDTSASLTSADITFWDIHLTYLDDRTQKECRYIRRGHTRDEMERLYRSTDTKTRYYVRALASRGCK